jgi:hypothetical protein
MIGFSRQLKGCLTYFAAFLQDSIVLKIYKNICTEQLCGFEPHRTFSNKSTLKEIKRQ